MQRLDFIYFKDSPKGGRGVFTADYIPKDTLIEICPVLVLSNEDREKIHQTFLHDYYFLWDDQGKQAAIALGYGSLYNHSDTPNIAWVDWVDNVKIFYALRDIKKGEELFFNYNNKEYQF